MLFLQGGDGQRQRATDLLPDGVPSVRGDASSLKKDQEADIEQLDAQTAPNTPTILTEGATRVFAQHCSASTLQAFRAGPRTELDHF